jgi:SAM-dependent methyltransferase
VPLRPVFLHGPNVSVNRSVLNHELPFTDEEFDYVRLSGHTFSIPKASWPWILSEIHRVLRRGGHLEIIEDELVFPMAPPVADCAPGPQPVRDADDDDEEDEDDDSLFSLDSETTVRSSWAGRLSTSFSAAAAASFDRAELYTDMHKHCADMETLFRAALDARDLLQEKDHLAKALARVFGKRATAAHAPIELHLPSRAFIEAAHAHADTDPLLGAALGLGRARNKAGRMLGCARDDVRALEDRARVSRVGTSSKAARMLGLACAPAAGTYAPPGLVAIRPGEPPRLLALAPCALTAHATRFPRALTAHERELEAAFAGHAGVDGAPTLNACDMADSVWEYHTLHRRRLGMPLADPGDALTDDFAAAAVVARSRASSAAPVPGAPAHVHTLEVPALARAPSLALSVRGRPSSAPAPAPWHGVALSSALPPGEGLTRVRSFRIYAATKA